ncbi:MAG: esterase family protein [Anaerolineales bacterium]|nr:esterase family protein [Anaerolineales bacterium]
MHRDYRKWHSPALHREMELLIFGHAGARVLVFPTSKGKYYEWEDRKMMDALWEPLERGFIQLYCVDSVDAESWYNWGAHPGYRGWRQTEYENYLLHEVLPLSWHLNPNPFLITTGASFGAYHAVDFALRHPELVGRVLGMSGFYNVENWTDGYREGEVYYHSPCLYLKNEWDSQRIEQLRKIDLILTTAWDDPIRYSTDALSQALWDKNIWHAKRVWDGWAHDWPWWQKQIKLYLGGHD